jgi:hypothetical protein
MKEYKIYTSAYHKWFIYNYSDGDYIVQLSNLDNNKIHIGLFIEHRIFGFNIKKIIK